MPRWLPRVLKRIRKLVVSDKVFLTLKARRELASIDFGLDEEDASDVLAGLTREDSAGRLVSDRTGEWMYLFKPTLAGTVCYVKIIIRRTHCTVISFHEDNGGAHEEEA